MCSLCKISSPTGAATIRTYLTAQLVKKLASAH